MADTFALIDAGKVWQNVKTSLSTTATLATQKAFDGLKEYLATQKRNPDLQFVPFSEVEADVAGGTVRIAATQAHKVYAVYIKKEANDTDNLFLVYDDGTDDTTDANARIALSVLIASQEAFAIYPDGLPMVTGLLVTQYTSASGLGKSDGSNGGDGFILIGRA